MSTSRKPQARRSIRQRDQSPRSSTRSSSPTRGSSTERPERQDRSRNALPTEQSSETCRSERRNTARTPPAPRTARTEARTFSFEFVQQLTAPMQQTIQSDDRNDQRPAHRVLPIFAHTGIDHRLANEIQKHPSQCRPRVASFAAKNVGSPQDDRAD